MNSPNAPRRIEGVEGVLEALRSVDLGLRVSILRALAGNPEKALEYDGTAGDLQAELLSQLQSASGTTHRYAVLAALFPFPQAELFWREFLLATDLDMLLLVAKRLGREPAGWLLPRLLEALDLAGPSSRREVVANMLAWQSALEPAAAVKVAVIATKQTAGPRPPLDETVWPTWQRLLEGRYQQKARVLVEGHPEGPEIVTAHWEDLTGPLKAWALDWLFPDPAVIAKALAESELRPRLLPRFAKSPELADVWRPQLQSLWPLASQAERASLVDAGVSVEDPVAEFHRASELALRCALLARWPLEAPWEEPLCQPDWQLRSAAMERLALLRVETQRLDEWAGSAHEGLRITAVQLRPEAP